MDKEIYKQVCSIYETPRVRVIELAVLDVLCTSKENTSKENGGEDNGAWWD